MSEQLADGGSITLCSNETRWLGRAQRWDSFTVDPGLEDVCRVAVTRVTTLTDP